MIFRDDLTRKFALLALTVGLTLGAASAQSAPLVIQDPAERVSLYQRALVWQRPPWISANFEFQPNFDLQKGPVQSGNLSLLHANEISCLTTDEDIETGDTRGSAKFKCQLVITDPVTGVATPLLDQNGKREMIKVKYTQATKENPEVYGEVFGTRLLWALGFAADEMYAVEKVHCYGCPADPFVDRKTDPQTLRTPRTFVRNAVEVKYPGREINFVYRDPNTGISKPVSGWTFASLMKMLPDDPIERAEALKHRDAFRLLSLLIHHVDNKSVNQRGVCPAESIVDDKCVGRPVFLIHDIGTILGVTDDWKKLDFKRWIRDPLWKDPRNCIATLKFPGLADPSFENAAISESGRKFLENLLIGFTGGEQGRARLRSLFLTSRFDQRTSPETVDMWVDAFLSKVDEVRFPMGTANPDFHCPASPRNP